MMSSRGALLLAAARTASVAFDSSSGSDRGPSRRPSAVVSASRCHSARFSNSPNSGCSTRWSAAKLRPA
jgi:hypothetical protein